MIAVVILLYGCANKSQSNPYQRSSGETMGTSYNITYDHPKPLTDEFQKLLNEIEASLSTYIKESPISRFNDASYEGSEIWNDDVHFQINTNAAIEVYETSDGYFDPTVMPLVNYWGFGPTGRIAVEERDESFIDSIMNHVGFNRIISNDRSSVTRNAFVQLDFSSIAKGYAVDVLADFLEDKGVKNYLVEVGGEMRLLGTNEKNKIWSVAINTPQVNTSTNDVIKILSVGRGAVATSGNYRNYHKVGGQIYGHTINPKTGYPEYGTLLSTTIIGRSCMFADAYATACMAMGVEKALEMMQNIEGYEAYFISSDDNNKMITTFTNGFIQYSQPNE